jgi:hypothetical protein
MPEEAGAGSNGNGPKADNPVVRLSFELALAVLAYVEELEAARYFGRGQCA